MFERSKGPYCVVFAVIEMVPSLALRVGPHAATAHRNRC